MNSQRRRFVRNSLLLIPGFLSGRLLASPFKPKPAFRRVRPGDANWPSEAAWNNLNKNVNGNLIKLQSPLSVCQTSNTGCDELFAKMKNPYYLGDEPSFTQTSGYLNAWQSEPSVYAVSARSSADIAAAVNFAREHKLRLVVKGGGHSYLGASNSKDSLLVWTRAMNSITLHDNFLPEGCEGIVSAQPAVTIESGALWLQAYNEVTVKNGRYVQGGGCTTVGVAGFIQGGGFGSFSKHYGLGAAALLQAEIVTADGKVIIANAAKHPDLFWALKGGGGGTFGVVTKLTLRTRELPQTFGGVLGSIKATTDKAFKELISKFVSFYQSQLFNHQWGEQVSFNGDNTMELSMLFHGLSQEEAQKIWAPFQEWVKSKSEYEIASPVNFLVIPAQRLWDAAFLQKYAPETVLKDDRPGVPAENLYWRTNREEAGQFLYAYRSAWVPATLLQPDKQNELANALFEASRNWTISLHFNKGLAGAPKEEIDAARNTAMNPAVLDAFALAIVSGQGAPAFKAIKGHEPDLSEAKRGADRINRAMNALLKVVPAAGSYVSESDYFDKNWKRSYWGNNYERLLSIKKKYDPDGLFFVHHGVGSEGWSEDGFVRVG